MTAFLSPERHPARNVGNDPYHPHGARNIVTENRDDVMAMLASLDRASQQYAEGKVFLAKSPLRSKPWIAGAMKTLGLIDERPSPNGACAVVLTPRGREQVSIARAHGWIGDAA